MNEFFRLVIDGTSYLTRTTRNQERRKRHVPANPREVKATIPGVIQEIRVKAGDKVRRGDGLLVLEAMKMKNDVRTTVDAVIRTVHVSRGEMVTKGQTLIELD